MDGFEEIVPGVLINTKRDVKVFIPHPDPIWVIKNKEGTALIANCGAIFVFSSEELANKYIEKTKIDGGFLKCFSWDELVDKFSNFYRNALVDHKGEFGFYKNVPLKKGI